MARCKVQIWKILTGRVPCAKSETRTARMPLGVPASSRVSDYNHAHYAISVFPG